MEPDKRNGQSAVPENPGEVLNEEQLITLNKMEAFGWKLSFVRRPLFQDIVAVLLHPDNGTVGVLELDGSLNMKPDIEIRE